jgi:hypothetical protein
MYNERFYLLASAAGLTDMPERREDLLKFMEMIVHECACVADVTILPEGRTYRDEFRSYFAFDQDPKSMNYFK